MQIQTEKTKKSWKREGISREKKIMEDIRLKDNRKIVREVVQFIWIKNRKGEFR